MKCEFLKCIVIVLFVGSVIFIYVMVEDDIFVDVINNFKNVIK